MSGWWWTIFHKESLRGPLQVVASVCLVCLGRVDSSTSWKDSSSSLWEGVLDGCGEPSLTVVSSCSSAMAERSGDGGRVFCFFKMKGSMEKGSWIESFVGGSCE